MILGTRCQYMLPNRMQCANSALYDSEEGLCLLHTQTQESLRQIETAKAEENTTAEINPKG